MIAHRVPPRRATDEHLRLSGRVLDVTLDVDLGELARGRHVVARGITLGGLRRRRASGDLELVQAELHYEFVPGATDEWADRHESWWDLSVTDDVNTKYSDSTSGGYASGGGVSTAGFRQLGGQVPQHARRLTIWLHPFGGWEPPEPWRRQIEIDLSRRRLIE